MALGTLLLGGCLLPQEDAVLDPVSQKNRPPRILEQTVVPLQQQVTLATYCTQEFSALVEDPDIDDKLTYRWYVDFDPNPGSPTRTPVEEQILQNGGEALRPESARWLANTGSSRTPISEIGPHVVTLMVFDGTLGTFEGPGSVPEADPIDGVDGGNPRFSTTYSWFVDVSSTATCPTGQ